MRAVKVGRETSSGEASAEVDRVGSKGSIISRYLAAGVSVPPY